MNVFTVDSKKSNTATDKVSQKVLVLFSSYYFADKADKALAIHGVIHQLMPVPPELSSACGLAIGVAESYMEDVLKIFEEHKITPSHMYYYEKGKEILPYAHGSCSI
ncbi:DUF3343 domain-containing protein [Veillonella sp. CHU740]|uniref:DUF3343 domain-containing protein n=1 Tax=Veillonella sp. CHU740 TaxID=2490950 RepID=UPI000F8EF9B4|nr:DUF3343 domain-containing protein [Veillonella sp. CHU740]